MTWPNKITGANAGERWQLPSRTRWGPPASVSSIVRPHAAHSPGLEQNSIMNTLKLLSSSAVCAATIVTSHAQGVNIDSLATNGRMTWTAPTGSICRVEWAASLGTNTAWRQNWLSLQDIYVRSSNTTVDVPMFYRVACLTNMFYPMPLTRTFAMRFQQGSQVSTQVFSFAGILALPSTTNEYVALPWVSGSTVGFGFARSTTDALYELWHGAEQPRYRLAPIGTTWTIQKGKSALVQVTIATNEVVTVAAGTFSALKFRNEVVQGDCFLNLGDVWYEWISPGLGFVKFFDPSESAGLDETGELLYIIDQ